MNKALIGSIAGLLVLGGTAVGGSLYADQQLTDKAYSPELMQRSFGLANFQAQTNLGILSGSAQWQGDLVFDPCQPGDKITIRGNDTIHRSLSGYRIDSKIYIVSNSPELHTYFLEGFLLNARRHISWGGNVQTSFNLPGRTVQKDGNTLTWQDISGQVSLHKENNELIPTELQFSIPAIELKSGQTSFSLQNLSHRSQNSFLGHGKLRPGNSETTLAALTFISSPGNSIIFSQIKTNGTQSINGQITAWGSNSHIQRIDITQSAGNKHSIEGLQLNSSVNGLNTQAMQSFSDLLSRQRSVCIPRDELKTKLSEIATTMLNSGLTRHQRPSQPEQRKQRTHPAPRANTAISKTSGPKPWCKTCNTVPTFASTKASSKPPAAPLPTGLTAATAKKTPGKSSTNCSSAPKPNRKATPSA